MPQTENKMGTMPVSKLLFTMSLPMMVSMLVQALYNIIDSIFVAQISEAALTAVSLAFPVQNLMIAVSAGTCVGVNALLSRSLGEGRKDAANLTAVNGVFLALLSYLAFAFLGLFFSRIYFSAQTSNPEIVELGIDYLTICTVLGFGIFGEMMFERLLQSTGRTIYNMYSQGTGAIINIILDPILIFGLFGAPKMGIQGAALATVIGQIIAMIMSFLFNQKKNTDIKLSFHGFRPHGATIRTIYQVGVPSMIMQSIGSAMLLGMNKILITFSETAVSVLGVYFKLQSFIFMPIFGLNNGMIPIIAYNLGAQRKTRITHTIKLSIISAISIMLVGLVIFQIFPKELLLMFNASEHMLEVGVPALKIISLSFLFAGYCIIVSSVFQALGNGVYSLIVSVIRQLIGILPLAYIFANAFGLNAVWWSFPLAELLSVTFSTILFIRIYRLKIKPIRES